MSGFGPAGVPERLQRANVLRVDGRYEEAIAEYREVLIADGCNIEARLGLGLSLCFAGDFDASLEELKCAVKYGPDHLDARLNLAKTYAMLGMYDEAAEEFQQVLRISPGHREAIKQLAFFESFKR